MPSLQVVHEQVQKSITEDTYAHFYAHFTNHEVEKYNTYDRDAAKHRRTSLMLQFWKLLVMVCFLNFLIYWIQFRWVETVNYKENEFYHKYKLYFVKLWSVNIFVFISTLSMVYIFMNQYYKHSLKLIILIAFMINIVINGPILTILSYEYHIKNNNIFHLTFICNSILLNNTKFQANCPYFFSFYQIYFYVFSFPICLLLSIFINHCLYFRLNSTKYKTHRNGYNINIELNINEKNDNNANQLQLLEHQTSLLSENPTNTDTDDKSLFFWFILFAIVFIVFNICIRLVTKIFFYATPFIYYFYALIIVTVLFKLILKYIGRKIDIINVNLIKNVNNNIIINIDLKWFDYISFELLMECLIDMIYFSYYIL